MKRLGLRLLTAAALLLAGGRLSAAEIQVAAAASLSDALRDIKTAYEAAGGGDTVVLNLGASSTLARQIEEGAPPALSLWADEAKVDQRAGRGRVVAASRKSVLSNTLVVVVPVDST